VGSLGCPSLLRHSAGVLLMSAPGKQAKLDDVIRVFAEAIYPKAKALNTLRLSVTQRARILESISGDIRKCTEYATTCQRRRAGRCGKNWD
jgi:hypothetical protein